MLQLEITPNSTKQQMRESSPIDIKSRDPQWIANKCTHTFLILKGFWTQNKNQANQTTYAIDVRSQGILSKIVRQTKILYTILIKNQVYQSAKSGGRTE